MLKTVSTNGYTLLFEKKKCGDIDCIAYETGKPMTVEQIGNNIDLSRMSVSRHLKKSLSKVYSKIKYRNKNISPCDIICSMALVFNLHTVEEYRNFLNLLPEEIRREVNEEARKAA